MIISGILLVLCATGPGDVSLDVSLGLSASELKVGDPIFVRVSFVNRGDNATTWPFSPNFGAGEVKVQVRRPIDEGYVDCRTGQFADEVYQPMLRLEPGAVDTALDVMLPSDNSFLTKPGIYQIRARVVHIPPKRDEKQTIFHSDPIEIRVSPRPEEERKLIASRGLQLDWGVSAISSPTVHRYDEALVELERSIGPSAMKTTLVWSRMIREYQPGGQCADQQLTAIKNLSLTVDPVTAEAISMCVAHRLYYAKQWNEAIEFLEVFKDHNPNAENLRTGCKSELERAKLNEGSKR